MTVHPVTRRCVRRLSAPRARWRRAHTFSARFSQTFHMVTKLRDCWLPIAKPDGSPWCLRRSQSQFPSQQNQIIGDVDVVEGFCAARRQLKDLNARQQSVKRAPCSHTIIFEERRVSGLRANEIVTSVVGRADNHIMCGEYFERALQNRRCKVWAVAIERNDVLPAGGSEVSKDRSESCREALTLLRYDRNGIA